MKIGIIGYGKMGKAVEKIAVQRGHSIAFKTNDFNLNLIVGPCDTTPEEIKKIIEDKVSEVK